MALSALVQSGLSIASAPNGTSPAGSPVGGPATQVSPFLLAQAAPAGINPTQAFQAANDTGTQIFQYPSDLPMYYIQLDLAKYSRASWLTVGTLSTIASIVLPMPAQILDPTTVEYETKKLGTFGAVYDALGQDNPNNAAKGAAQKLGGVAGSAIGNIANAITPEGAGAASAALGLAINNYLTVMLKGPTYKVHRFSWRFSPKSKEESVMLETIYLALREASAPALTTTFGSAFFQYPNLCTPKFHYADKTGMGNHLYYFKPCFIKNITANFTPNGTAAFYAASQAIEGFELTIFLEEVEYWLSGSYTNAMQSDGQNTQPNLTTNDPLANLSQNVQNVLKSITPLLPNAI